jgi:CDP-glycerol glycerophosphotransferase (TagB/SpsB family)
MKKNILRWCFKPLSWLNKIIKKDNKIFIYSNLGFRDNVKAFYNYLIGESYNDKYEIIVSINDYERYVSDAPYNVTFKGNKQGIWDFIKSKYAFYCFGKYPIKPSNKQTVVNLWHGTPLKKIGNLEKGCENTDYNFFTFVVTAAPDYKQIMADIFGCRKNQVEVLGNPRNDELFMKDAEVDNRVRGDFSKVIAWLPTYREYNKDYVISILSRNDIEKLNEKLKHNNIRLIIKLHPLQEATIEKKEYSNILMINQRDLEDMNMTVYSILRNADGLITDYSSVFFDYLMLDRPIAFTVDDIDQYKNQRGFIFDNPYEYMPGMKIKNYIDVEMFINDISNDEDLYADDRAKVNEKVNYYRDGNSAKRVAERVFGGKTVENN